MTLYADSNYYMNDYKGNLISDEDIEKYLKMSQEKIDTITHNRIVKIGFENLTEFQKVKVKESVCAQADYIYENGYNNEESNDISSYSVLDISVNIDNSKKEQTKANMLGMSDYAYENITKTGLATNSWRYYG